MKKRIISIIICLFLLFSLTACGEGGFVPSQKAFKTVQTSVPAENKIVAQNGKYSLEYVVDMASVNLIDNESGTVWEVCPTPTAEQKFDALGMPIKRNAFTQSVLEVGYMDEKISGGGNMNTVSFTGAVGSGHVIVKEIKNGVTVEYYFDAQKFMIPVDYVLSDDYLSVSIDTTKILEDEFKVTYVSLLPFACSAENDIPDSYLFIPSGSGALINNKSVNEQGITYSAYVYGEDLTMEEQYLPTNETSIRMPVYGYKSGEKGGFAIIDKGADTAVLNTTSGNTGYGFSAIYPSFQLRGYTAHKAKSFSKEYTAKIFPENMIEGTLSLRFYPLSAESANYNEMANIYRNYLIKEKGLTAKKEEKALSVNLIGGTMITKSFLGIPYQTLYPATTLKQAENIVTDISKSVKDFAVKLTGFGTTGVDAGKIGGGFKISSNLTDESSIKDFYKTCTDKNIDMYFDYDVVKFSSSGSGFSTFSDVVMNSGYIRSDQFIYDKALRNNEEKLSYRLLRPVRFADAVKASIDNNSDWKVDGIAFDTLSSLSYSDYSDYNSTVLYNAKHGFSDAVTNALSQVKKANQKYMADSANDYAAVLADIITDTPISSDNGYAFIENIPFYSMVFKGYVPMTTESINLSADEKRTILGAVEGGLGLNYTLISNWDNALIDAVYPTFYASVYSGVKDEITELYGELSSYYDSINGSKIVSSTIIEKGVHCTVFDNGVMAYVNYNSAPAQTPAGEIGALDYIILGGAA